MCTSYFGGNLINKSSTDGRKLYRIYGFSALVSVSICFSIFVFSERGLTENEKKLTLLATDLLTVIIKGNLENARELSTPLHIVVHATTTFIPGMFSDCFGARTLLSILTVVTGEWRSSGLQLLKQLLLLASTDQYIAGVIQASQMISTLFC